jgi:hypothetical protein
LELWTLDDGLWTLHNSELFRTPYPEPEGIDQRGLANARLADDEDELVRAMQRLIEPRVELREVGFPTHQDRVLRTEAGKGDY